MEKKVSYILAAIELIGLLLILWLFPADSSVLIVVKTALALVWIAAFFIFRKKYNKK